jgi:hypothetical protein
MNLRDTTTSVQTLLLIWVLLMTGTACEKRFPSVQDLPVQHQLPDPFIMLDGSLIKTKDDWINKRRPELKLLFQHYVYGYLPPSPPFNFVEQGIDTTAFDGLATYKEVILNLELPGDQTHAMNIAIFIPNERSEAWPVFVALNACGNHTLVSYEGISVIEYPWQPPNCVRKYARLERWYSCQVPLCA